MCHSHPPAEPRHLLPSCWECCQLSMGLSLAQGCCLSQAGSFWGQPLSCHWSVWGTKAQPCHLSLDISEKSPQLLYSLGPFGTTFRSASPSTLPNPASFTSSPRIHLPTNHRSRKHCDFLSPRAWDQTLQCPSSKGLAEGSGFSCSTDNYRRTSWGLLLQS